MRDYHCEQFDPRTTCSSKNCAACSGAMGLYFGSRGRVTLSGQAFRNASGVSCVAGRDTPSGGLNINAIERVFARYGVKIDYRRGGSYLRRWTEYEGRLKLSTYYGAIILGDYDALRAPWRAPGSTFRGDHSVWAHDLRSDKRDSVYKRLGLTVCWHDPLRQTPIRIPWTEAVRYWQKSGSAVKGFAGFVRIPPVAGGSYGRPMPDRTRTTDSEVAVHNARTVGSRSTVRTIRSKGALVSVYMYAPGESYKGSREWCALSLLGTEWVHTSQLDHVRGTT